VSEAQPGVHNAGDVAFSAIGFRMVQSMISHQQGAIDQIKQVLGG